MVTDGHVTTCYVAAIVIITWYYYVPKNTVEYQAHCFNIVIITDFCGSKRNDGENWQFVTAYFVAVKR